MGLAVQKKFEAILKVLNRREDLSAKDMAALEAEIDIYFEIYTVDHPHLSKRNREILMLSEYLRRTDKYICPDLLGAITQSDDNIVEIYGFDYSQLYRSASFLEFQTYTLITLMTHSNFELYSRDGEFIPKIQEQVKASIDEQRIVKFDVPTHKVWESFEGGSDRYHWLMTLGLCAPVFSALTQQPCGFLVTHKTVQVFTSPFRKAALTVV